MRKEFVRRTVIALFTAAIFIISGCSNSPGEGWEKSGTDTKRGIDHFYLKSSVKPLENSSIRVKTKLLPQKGDKAVEQATKVQNAFSVEVEGVVYCDASLFMILSKEYLDKQGISVKIENDGGGMDAVVKIKKGEALYPMVQEICRQTANIKPRQGVITSVKKH